MSFTKRRPMAKAGSRGTSTPRVPGGMEIMGRGDKVFPSNCGKNSRWASSISRVISRISGRVQTADVSGSRAMAWKARSGSPVRAASTANPCTVTLL